MPAKSSSKTARLAFSGHAVTVVVVSHNGAAWLPATLTALAEQTRPPQRVVAVDTGSDDASPTLLADSLGDSAVLNLPADTGLGAAIQAGLDAFAGAPPPPGIDADAVDWVWVLHDDCAPDPEALQRLLERVDASPSVTVAGPKVLSWDRRRLLEVGVTTDGSGRRETMLEPREVDQGQHDNRTDVLAVGTAGMLVRRDAWDRLGGLDPQLPLFGDDIDFGWRVNADGGRVVVATDAVVRHAAGLAGAVHRRARAVNGRPGGVARAHGMRVVLMNTSAALAPFYVVRFVVESLLRALAEVVLLRRPRRAADEITGLRLLLARPRLVLSGRAKRRGRSRAHREIRPLLAPASLRWRHFGDAVAAAFGGRAAAEERRRRRAPVETGPVSEEAESFDVDDLGVLQRFVRRPGVLLALVLTVLALVVDRRLLGGALHGGRLLPATDGASDLWRTYSQGWHPVGLGSTTTAPPALAVLALFSTLLFGKVWLVIDLLVIGAVPLAGLSAYLAAGAISKRAVLRIPVAVAYALLPPITGAAVQGRVDVTAAAILLPLTARACAAAVRSDPRRAGWHRAAGAGVLLALVTALVPVLWAVAVPVLLLAALPAPAAGRAGRVAAAVATAAVAPVLLLPWTAYAVGHPSALVRGLGLPEPLQSRRPIPFSHLLFLHPGGPGQPPWWAWAPLVLAAVVATAYVRRGAVARVATAGAVFALAAAVAVTRDAGVAAGAPGSRYWSGGLLVAAGLGFLVAVAVAAAETPYVLRSSAFGWRQPGAAVLGLALAVGLAIAAVHWVGRSDVGAAGTVRSGNDSVLPVFAVAAAEAPTTPRVLALRADADAVHYALLRGARGQEIGDADVAANSSGPAAQALASAVRNLAAGRPEAAGQLASFGITLVVVPADAGGALARIGQVPGLARVPATSTVVYRTTLPAGELTVIAPRTQPLPLPAAGGHAATALPAGPAGRLLVLAEPFSAHWRATFDGHALPATHAYGWAQAWTLPAAGGRLVVDRTGSGRSASMGLEFALFAVALLLCIPARRFGRAGSDPDTDVEPSPRAAAGAAEPHNVIVVGGAGGSS
ncbi:MAG: glycosyltransferase family 2 protein [Frankiaceae bacterium]|nr:glycosyltransferase family 2 protein [Frankiaceae bacterium]MBV9369221.1 glycosyltransferase family 2 protein [Frankiales bacterium]